jgi:hypothetical protein
MDTNTQYSEDGSSVVLASRRPDQADKVVPVHILDTLLDDSSFTVSDVEKALLFRKITKGHDYEWVNIQDLVGVNLVGKQVYVSTTNWNTFEWVTPQYAVTVRVIEHDGVFMYCFVTSDEDSTASVLSSRIFFNTNDVLIVSPRS